MPIGPPDALKLTGAPAWRSPMPVTSCSMLPGTDTDAFSRGVPAVAGFDIDMSCAEAATLGPQSVVAYPARTI